MADARATAALEFLQEQIDKLLAEVSEKQKMANSFAVAAGLDAPYAQVVEATATTKKGGAIRADLFANHSAPSTAARAYLEYRGKERGAATVDEIYDALVKGGFMFNVSAGDAKNSLRIALGKDGQVVRLPNAHYGMASWYPNMGKLKDKVKRGAGDHSDAAEHDDGDDSGDDSQLLGTGAQEAAEKPS